MVVHTGDIVDTWNDTSQWSNANNAMSVLLENHIPYSWGAGNHDCKDSVCYSYIGKKGYSNYIGNNYSAFNPSIVSINEPANWVAQYDKGESTAVRFTVGKREFIIVNIEYLGDSDVLNWANNILATHQDAYAIIATHAFLDADGIYISDREFAQNLKDTVLNINPNVFITLNGHDITSNGYNMTETFDENRTINELMFDRQEEGNRTGANAVTILNFTIESIQAKVHVTTLDLNNDTKLSEYDIYTSLPTDWIERN